VVTSHTALDLDALVAAMERYRVPETVVDLVDAAVETRPTISCGDILDLLKANGVSAVTVSRIKNAMVPPLTSSSLATANSQSTDLSESTQPAVRIIVVMCLPFVISLACINRFPGWFCNCRCHIIFG
jgi:hypothetical protein